MDSWENPQLLQVRLKVSKTDPFQAGVDVFVGTLGNGLCPIAAVHHGRSRSWPLTQVSPLSRPRFVVELKKALSAAGWTVSHTWATALEVGQLTTAVMQGLEDSTIKEMEKRGTPGKHQNSTETPCSHDQNFR